MIPLNWLCRYASRPPPLGRTLTTTSGLLKECGKSSRDKHKDDCRKHCEGKKQKKSKSCDKSREVFPKDSLGKEDCGDELPDYCSKKMAMECAKRIKELQQHWEAVAAQAQKAPHSQQGGAPKKPSGCPVKPPKKEEKGGGNTGIILGAIAVVVALLYWFSQQQPPEEGEGENKEKSE